MAIDYKTPEQIAEQYLQHLKTLKPEVNTKQTDSDWWVRSRVVGGVFSGIYADQRKIANDAFPQSARREALEQHLIKYFGSGFRAATPAVGSVLMTGASGSVVPLATQMSFEPNGNVYASTEEVLFGTAVSAVVPVQSIDTGQNQNLLEGAELKLASPPAGVDSTCTIYGGNFSDGRDEESNEQAAERILLQVRSPLAGGKVDDYKQFAQDADPSVTSASVLRFPFGFGTVGVVITAGTSDVDQAIDNGDPVVRLPSDDLIAAVQDYIETKNPVTDCATVLRPVPVAIDVEVKVRFASGNSATIPSGQTLSQGDLVKREVSRALYKMPPGGRVFGGVGYVLASEIEEVLDLNLSGDPYTVGEKAQILVDRQVLDLTVTGANRMILGIELAEPGTITVTELA